MRTMRSFFCIFCLIVSGGCGALSQNHMSTPFGSDSEEEAFRKAVAADSFPRADQAAIRGISKR